MANSVNFDQLTLKEQADQVLLCHRSYKSCKPLEFYICLEKPLKCQFVFKKNLKNTIKPFLNF